MGFTQPQDSPHVLEIDAADVDFGSSVLIGKGSWGEVRRVKWQGEWVAAKVLRPDALKSKRAMRDFFNEVELLSAVSHPNVVRYVASCTNHARPLSPPLQPLASPSTSSVSTAATMASGMTDNSQGPLSLRSSSLTSAVPPSLHSGPIFLLIEYTAGGDLHNLLRREGELDAETALRFSMDIARAMVYLHQRQPYPIIHRDLKPQNLLVSAQGSIKVADFGLAVQLSMVGGGVWAHHRPKHVDVDVDVDVVAPASTPTAPTTPAAPSAAAAGAAGDRVASAPSSSVATAAEEAAVAGEEERQSGARSREDANGREAVDTFLAVHQQLHDGGAGTHRYMAPEMFRRESYGPAVDVFSFGIVTHEMFEGGQQMGWLEPEEVAQKYVEGVRPTFVAKSYPPGIKELITECWSPLPQDRPTFLEVLSRLEAIRENMMAPVAPAPAWSLFGNPDTACSSSSTSWFSPFLGLISDLVLHRQ